MDMSDVKCLDAPDLSADLNAVWAVKDEMVTVEFAVAAGTVESAVGRNRYEPGDALLTGSTGDRWCVSRARFEAKYRAESPTRAGHPGRYRNLPVAVRAKRMAVPFSVARAAGGDLLSGAAGDWLMQYGPGDYGIVAAARFDKVYRAQGKQHA
jgi:uncharacterized protein (DUF2237 family)